MQLIVLLVEYKKAIIGAIIALIAPFSDTLMETDTLTQIDIWIGIAGKLAGIVAAAFTVYEIIRKRKAAKKAALLTSRQNNKGSNGNIPFYPQAPESQTHQNKTSS